MVHDGVVDLPSESALVVPNQWSSSPYLVVCLLGTHFDNVKPFDTEARLSTCPKVNAEDTVSQTAVD